MLQMLNGKKAERLLRAAACILMAVCAAQFLLTEIRFALKAPFLDVLPYPVALLVLCWIVRGDFRCRPLYWLGLAFIVWFAVTRLLIGDTRDRTPYYFLVEIGILYAFVFPFAHASGDAERLRFFDGFAAAFTALVTAGSLVGLWAVVGSRDWLVWNGGYRIGLDEDLRLEILGVNPNGCGVFMALAILLSFYLLARHWKPARLAPALAAALINYWALAATDSRTAEISFSVAAGAAAAALTFALVKKKTWLRAMAALCAAALMAALCYFGFGVGVRTINALARQDGDRREAVVETDEDSGAAAPVREIESRGQGDFYTSGRMDIYKSFFAYLKDRPSVLLHGADNFTIRMMTSYGMEERLANMKLSLHNSFFQTLATVGLPGLGLVLAICVWLLIGSLRLLFDRERSAWERLLPTVLLLLIVDSMAESPLFVPFDQTSNGIFDLIFFLCAGYVAELGRKERTGARRG